MTTLAQFINRQGIERQEKRDREALLDLLQRVAAGVDPEDQRIADLDDEQPMHVSVTLGNIRFVKRILREANAKS